MATELKVSVDTTIHELEAIKRCCYALASKVDAVLTRTSGDQIEVTFTGVNGNTIENDFGLLFQRKLIDFGIRLTLERKTGPIREMIFRQAFVEADF